MAILSLIAVLLLEQFKPLAEREPAARALAGYAEFFENRFNDGQRRHGTVAWLLAVLPPVILSAVIYYALFAASPLLALLWNIGILYLTMGFRQFSHYFTDIHLALRMGEIDRARELLREWRGGMTDRMGTSEVARVGIEEALVASHRHVFAVIVAFVLLPGPSGAVLYRLAEYLARHWGLRVEGDFGAFGDFSRRAFQVIDWLPLRVTATAFAIVGDFEDALYCWRTQAQRWPDPGAGVLLASGAGALGVRLGMPIVEYDELTDRPEVGVGEEADVDFMQSGIGLVWRSLVLYLLLLTLLAVAGWVGG